MNGWITMMEQVAGTIEFDLYGSELDRRQRDTLRYAAPARVAGRRRPLVWVRTGMARSLVKIATWIEPRKIEPSRVVGKVAR